MIICSNSWLFSYKIAVQCCVVVLCFLIDEITYEKHTVLGGLCILITSPVLAAHFPGHATRAASQVCCVSPLESWSQAATLLADVNCPGSQEDMISNWEPAHSLVESGGLWGWDCPLPSGSVCQVPVSLSPSGRGVGPVCSWLALLWYSLNPLSCEWARLCIRAFRRKVLCFSLFFSPRPLHSLGCYLTLAPSDCPQGV